MNVEFFDGLPHAEFGPRMLSLLAPAKRIDAAIAFVTQPGTKMLRKPQAAGAGQSAAGSAYRERAIPDQLGGA